MTVTEGLDLGVGDLVTFRVYDDHDAVAGVVLCTSDPGEWVVPYDGYNSLTRDGRAAPGTSVFILWANGMFYRLAQCYADDWNLCLIAPLAATEG